ncbi:MAG: hypothetical protein HC868_09735 [Sphingomonadales bacterium]|nr:hypothetical protein [Sphingomonadales bacterium]
MFRGLINDAKSAAGALIGRYLARASVAVPFIVAAGFVTAAITLLLVERYGAITACWAIAAGFSAIGLVASLVVSVKEQEEQIAEKEAEATDTVGVVTDTAAQAAAQAPLALLGALLSTLMGPTALAGGVKAAVRHWPLVLLLGLIALLFWPHEAEQDEDKDEVEPERARPDGAIYHPTHADLRPGQL